MSRACHIETGDPGVLVLLKPNCPGTFSGNCELLFVNVA